MPPIYQPALAGEAIVYAAEHPRREIVVGLPSHRAIVANTVAPGLLDRYLAATNYEAQQVPDQPVRPDRPDNLDAPLPGDHGAHGIFGDQAKSSDPLWWVSRNRGLAATAALGLAGLAELARGLWRR